MRLPLIKNENRYKRRTVSFGGLNTGPSFSEGEMRDCTGISHSFFPFITQRAKSEVHFVCESPTALVFGKKECVAASGSLYYDGKKVCDLSEGRKQLVVMGEKILVFPDKLYYDTISGKVGDLRAKYELYGVEVTFTENSITVPEHNFIKDSKMEVISLPSEMEVITYASLTTDDGKITFNGFSLTDVSALTKGQIFVEKCDHLQYRTVVGISLSDDGKSYTVTNELITVRDSLKDVFADIKQGDIVEISGSSVEGNNKMVAVKSVQGHSINFPAATFTAKTETGVVTVQRKIPDFTSVCSYQNRLWGCEGNTIYASALGEPASFFVYNNLSTDSFTVQSGTAGDFTACIAYGNGCLFFKENSCYKLFGNRPSNFTLSECTAGGIAKEDIGSLVNVNGRIIYNGTGGIYVYSGGTPYCVSDKLFGIRMRNTVAGSDEKRYYITADTDNGREEYVFDIEKALWSKTGVKGALGYTYCGGNMFRLTEKGIEKILDEPDETVHWSVTLCPFNEGYHKWKKYSRIFITATLSDGAHIVCEVRSDGGVWKTVATHYGDGKKHLNIPCVIKNCHEAQIRLSGKGKSNIESIVREFSIG